MSEKIDEYAGTPFAGFEPVYDVEAGLFRSLIINTLISRRFADWLVNLSFNGRAYSRSPFTKDSLWNAFWMCVYETIEGKRNVERYQENCVNRDRDSYRDKCHTNGEGLNSAVPFTVCHGCRGSLQEKMKLMMQDAVNTQREKENHLKPEEIASIHKRLNGL